MQRRAEVSLTRVNPGEPGHGVGEWRTFQAEKTACGKGKKTKNPARYVLEVRGRLRHFWHLLES